MNIKHILIELGVVLFFLILFIIIFNLNEDRKTKNAIDLTLSESDLSGDIISEARFISASEVKEYPVIYDGVESKNPILVTNTGDTQSEACVVDNEKVLRCFNNINLG